MLLSVLMSLLPFTPSKQLCMRHLVQCSYTSAVGRFGSGKTHPVSNPASQSVCIGDMPMKLRDQLCGAAFIFRCCFYKCYSCITSSVEVIATSLTVLLASLYVTDQVHPPCIRAASLEQGPCYHCCVWSCTDSVHIDVNSGKVVDLRLLYSAVVLRGGFEAVSAARAWPQLPLQLGLLSEAASEGPSGPGASLRSGGQSAAAAATLRCLPKIPVSSRIRG